MFKNDHAALIVSSLDESRKFYVDLLGGLVVSKPAQKFLEIMLGEQRLHLMPASKSGEPEPHAPRLDHLCLSVETLADLVVVRDKLNTSAQVARFGPFVIKESPPKGDDYGTHAEERPPRRTLYFRDPDGLDLEVRCYS